MASYFYDGVGAGGTGMAELTCTGCVFLITEYGHQNAWTECHKRAPVLASGVEWEPLYGGSGPRMYPKVDARTDGCGEYTTEPPANQTEGL